MDCLIKKWLMSFEKITESDSNYDNLEKKSVNRLLEIINLEDQTVAISVKKVIPKIKKLIDKIIYQLDKGGRLFYIGSGTSGRLGVEDASECPPTFGVSTGLIVGIIAGGDKAIRNEHVYYMEKQKTIIDKAKGIGFKFIGKINMSVCNHPYEYLYVFQKTN